MNQINPTHASSGAAPARSTIPFPTLPRTICVVGLGYIGLPTSCILAQRGHRVYGVEVNEKVIAKINRGEVHIHEPHLDVLLEEVVAQGRLSASTQPCEADVFFICVPTPMRKDQAPDMSYVEAAARSIKPYVRPGSLIILESTSPPGTTAKVILKDAVPDNLRVGEDVFVAYCPERVLPGRILVEAIENDRIVGGMTPACTTKACEFYRSFVTGEVLPTNAISAELAKLVENSYRDVNIALANELSILAEQFNADPFEIIQLANHHPRVNILTPGPGVGGHCISVDPWFLVHASPSRTQLIRTARNVNDAKPDFIVEKVVALAKQHGSRSIGCLGLAYKADVDDLRESPSLAIVRKLQRTGIADLMVCEPYVSAESLPEFELHELDAVLENCDMIVLLTDHSQFREIPTSVLKTKTIVDTRGTWRERLIVDDTRQTAASSRLRAA